MSRIFTTEATERLSKKLQRNGLNEWVACTNGDTLGRYLIFRVGGRCLAGCGWSLREANEIVQDRIALARRD